MKIGQVWGVAVKLNNLFLVLFPVYHALGVLPQGLLAFGLVLAHEAAHSLAAAAQGLRPVEIELMPFGGVARLEGPLDGDPGVEIKTALAGPALNLMLAVAVYILAFQTALLGEYAYHPLVYFFLQSNLLLAGFNLLPALPLDGGRVYRAILSRIWGFHRATDNAARGGAYFAVLLGVFGFLGLVYRYIDAFVLILAVFLFFAAMRERREAMYHFMGQLMRKKKELPRKGSLPVRTVALQGDTPLKEAVRLILPNRWHVFMVIDGEGEVAGTLTETVVIAEFLKGGIERHLGDLLHQR